MMTHRMPESPEGDRSAHPMIGFFHDVWTIMSAIISSAVVLGCIIGLLIKLFGAPYSKQLDHLTEEINGIAAVAHTDHQVLENIVEALGVGVNTETGKQDIHRAARIAHHADDPPPDPPSTEQP